MGMDIQRWKERRHITYCRAAVPMMQSNKVEHSTNTAKRPGNTSTFSNKLSGNETTNRIVKENNFAYNHAMWVSLCSLSALPRWQCFTLRIGVPTSRLQEAVMQQRQLLILNVLISHLQSLLAHACVHQCTLFTRPEWLGICSMHFHSSH